MSDIQKPGSIYDSLIEAIKGIDTTNLTDSTSNNPSMRIVEEQKVFFWIRLYVNSEDLSVKEGDDIVIKYTLSGEELLTKFICYGKKGLERDVDNQVTNYSSEEDKKILCLMIDSKEVNYGQNIPFIRTLFKTGFHYEYQLVKRNELLFINKRTTEDIEYFDVDF